MVSKEDFLKAAEDSKKLTSKPSNEELLELYGTCIVNTFCHLSTL